MRAEAMRNCSDIMLSSEKYMMLMNAIQTDTVATAGQRRLLWM